MRLPFAAPARRAQGYLLMILGLWLVHTRGAAVAAPEPPVALKAVKYPDLVQAVKAQHGKVVVVEVWAEY
jgi:hypothetical protein